MTKIRLLATLFAFFLFFGTGPIFSATLEFSDAAYYKPKYLQLSQELNSKVTSLQKSVNDSYEKWTQSKSAGGKTSKESVDKVGSYQKSVSGAETELKELGQLWNRIAPYESKSSGKKALAQIQNLQDIIGGLKTKVLSMIHGMATQKFLEEKEAIEKQEEAPATLKEKIKAKLEEYADWLDGLGLGKLKKYFSSSGEKKQKKEVLVTEKKLEYLKMLVKHQKQMFGTYPANLDEVINVEVKGFLGGTTKPTQDAWGKPIDYKHGESDFTLRSPGPDGSLNTADDVTATVDAGKETPISD